MLTDLFPKLSKLVTQPRSPKSRLRGSRGPMQALQDIKANRTRELYTADEDLCCQSRPQLHLALSEIIVCPGDQKTTETSDFQYFSK